MPDASNTTQQVQAVTAAITSLSHEIEQWHEADLRHETDHETAQANILAARAQLATLNARLQTLQGGGGAADSFLSGDYDVPVIGLVPKPVVLGGVALGLYLLWKRSQKRGRRR